jgi:hypothetical protein
MESEIIRKHKKFRQLKYHQRENSHPGKKKSLPKRSSVFQKYNLRPAIFQVTDIMWGSSGSKMTRL